MQKILSVLTGFLVGFTFSSITIQPVSAEGVLMAKGKHPSKMRGQRSTSRPSDQRADKDVERDVSTTQTAGFNPAVESLSGKVEFDENPIGVAYGGTYKGGIFMPSIRDLHINSTQINIRWKEVETQKGRYNWRAVDSFVKQLQEGDRALIRIKTNSQWTSRGEASLPRDMGQYTAFVRTLVGRTHGKVKYFESDWEIDSRKFWDDTPENYLKLLKTFYETVKEVEPGAVVIFGGHSGHFKDGVPARHEIIDYIFQNGSEYFDIFDLHLYHELYTIPQRLRWFKERMDKYGIAKPIVVTEYGGPTPLEYPDKRGLAKLKRQVKQDYKFFESGLKGYPDELRIFAHNIPENLVRKWERLHASQIVKRTVLILASGAKRSYYWNMVSGGKHPVFGKLGLMTPRSEKKKAYRAFQQMSEMLGDIKSIERLDMKDPKVYAFKVLNRAGESVLVLWARADEYWKTARISVRIPVASNNVKIMDALGARQEARTEKGELLLELTEVPVFIK